MRIPRAVLTLLFLSASLFLTSDDASAQRRAGRGVRVVPGRVVVMRAYYAPLFYDPWFYPYGVGYGAYPPYPYGPAYAPAASLRIQAEPRETEVFVDGYYAGSVDDFDGMFQRLHLEPGEHDVTLYLAGHRTSRQSVYLQPGRTFRIHHTMEPLPAGSAPEPRPISAPIVRRGINESPRRAVDAPPAPASSPDAGTIAIRVQPAGAEILIDGEVWEGPADSEQLVVQVAPGAHRIEVRREGYRSYSADVDVRAGAVSPLNVSLSRQ
jgi:hypothetical protein